MMIIHLVALVSAFETFVLVQEDIQDYVISKSETDFSLAARCQVLMCGLFPSSSFNYLVYIYPSMDRLNQQLANLNF